MSHVLSAHTYSDGDYEWCCTCGAGFGHSLRLAEAHLVEEAAK